MEEVLKTLTFGVFEFVLVPKKTIVFPFFKGNVFRGALGKALKDLTCAFKTRDCKECLVRDRCLYARLFESHNVEGKSILKKIEKAPHPFIIYVPEQYHLEYPENRKIHFYLTLVGSAVEYISYFILAFEEIGHKGIGQGRSPFRVERVRVAGEEIYDPQEKKVGRDFFLFRGSDFLTEDSGTDNCMLKMVLESPLRLRFGGRFRKYLTFEMVVRSLLRRLHLLSAFYCGGPDWVDFYHLIERSKAVKTVDTQIFWQQQQRYSFRQERNVSMGGVSGWLSFSGPVNGFMPFIRPGEYLHLGSGTAFGLGKMKWLPL